MDMKNTCMSGTNVRERDFVRVQNDNTLNERWNQSIVQKRRLLVRFAARFYHQRTIRDELIRHSLLLFIDDAYICRFQKSTRCFIYLFFLLSAFGCI